MNQKYIIDELIDRNLDEIIEKLMLIHVLVNEAYLDQHTDELFDEAICNLIGIRIIMMH